MCFQTYSIWLIHSQTCRVTDFSGEFNSYSLAVMDLSILPIHTIACCLQQAVVPQNLQILWELKCMNYFFALQYYTYLFFTSMYIQQFHIKQAKIKVFLKEMSEEKNMPYIVWNYFIGMCKLNLHVLVSDPKPKLFFSALGNYNNVTVLKYILTLYFHFFKNIFLLWIYLSVANCTVYIVLTRVYSFTNLIIKNCVIVDLKQFLGQIFFHLLEILWVPTKVPHN